jgi:hypothetical protein
VQPLPSRLPQRELDQRVLGWIEVGARLVSIALSVIIGLQLLKQVAGLDLIEMIAIKIRAWRLQQMVRAWEREHANDGKAPSGD